jgi:hypothetical protein
VTDDARADRLRDAAEAALRLINAGRTADAGTRLWEAILIDVRDLAAAETRAAVAARRSLLDMPEPERIARLAVMLAQSPQGGPPEASEGPGATGGPAEAENPPAAPCAPPRAMCLGGQG